MPNTSKKNRIGWGFGSFGNFRWGWGDFAEIFLWNYLPEVYKTETAKRTAQELRKWTDGIKPLIQELRERIEFFPDLRDPSSAPENLLPFLANDVGFVDNQGRTEDKRRAAIFNAWLLYLTKGTEQGYKIIGSLNNVDVDVAGLWEMPCGSGVFFSAGPSMFTPLFDEVPLDQYDGMFDDFFLSGGNLLALRFTAVTEVVLLEVTEVKDLTDNVILVLGVDYSVDLSNGTISLLVGQTLGDQIRVTYNVSIPLDIVFLTETDLWPIRVESSEDLCRTNRIVLDMTRIDGAESEVPAGTTDILREIEEFKPAHVVIDSVSYTVNMPVSFVFTVELT